MLDILGYVTLLACSAFGSGFLLYPEQIKAALSGFWMQHPVSLVALFGFLVWFMMALYATYNPDTVRRRGKNSIDGKDVLSFILISEAINLLITSYFLKGDHESLPGTPITYISATGLACLFACLFVYQIYRHRRVVRT